MKKIGRNAPCPCGSGKKYKLCCAKQDIATLSANPPEGRTRYEPGSYGGLDVFFPSLMCYRETGPDSWEPYYCLVKHDTHYKDDDSATVMATRHLEAAFAAKEESGNIMTVAVSLRSEGYEKLDKFNIVEDNSITENHRILSDQKALEESLIRRVEENHPDLNVDIKISRNGIKISEVLDEFIAPYRKGLNTVEEYRKFMGVAVFAWNLALSPEEDHPSRVDEVIMILDAETRSDMKVCIEDLIKRKEKYFSHHRRRILDFEVADTTTGWNLSVIAEDEAI